VSGAMPVIHRLVVGLCITFPLLAVSGANPAAASPAVHARGALGPPGGIAELSCAGSLCVGVSNSEYEVAVSETDGMSWIWRRLPGKVPKASAISCSTSEDCVAAGALRYPRRGALWTTSDGGRNWQVRRLPRKVLQLNGVSCPYGTHCVATGFLGPEGATRGSVLLSASDFDGQWKVAGTYTDYSGGGSVSCASGGTCVAIYPGSSDLYSDDGGQHWHAIDAGVALDAVDCDEGSHCLGVAQGANDVDGDIITNDGGREWTILPEGNYVGAGILDYACPTIQNCVAIGQGDVDISNDGGRVWSAAPYSFPRTVRLTAVSCPTSRTCVAGGSIYKLESAPAANTSSSNPSGVVPLGGISPQFCQPVVFSTSDDGTSWTQRAVNLDQRQWAPC
jgi:hypothetical protein